VVITQGVSMYYRPFVPGCSPATLEFVVPYRPQRLDLGETLNRLGDNLRDRRARFTDLLKRLRATIESADVEAARKLAEDSEQLGDIKSLEVELAAVNQEAANAKYDIEPLHGQLVKELQAFRDEVRDAAVAMAASQAEIQGLRRRINDLWPKKRAWDELKTKLDRLAVLDPKDDAVNRRREWLNEALRADPPERANARETVDQAIRLSDSSQFVNDWSKLHPALERLLDTSDLWLLRVADAFPNWESLVAKEKSRLDADIKTLESGGTKEDAKRLEERQAKLTTATKQLAAVNERLDPVVKGLLQKAPM
jgi:predicted  nucleic acid-binding Zn-ribbon protein